MTCRHRAIFWTNGGLVYGRIYATPSLDELNLALSLVAILKETAYCLRIWRNWTFEMLVRYILSSVYLRVSPFSQISFMQYMGLCVFSLPISLMMIVRLYFISSYQRHHQIGNMSHLPLFRVMSWNKRLHCMSLYILIVACLTTVILSVFDINNNTVLVSNVVWQNNMDLTST